MRRLHALTHTTVAVRLHLLGDPLQCRQFSTPLAHQARSTTVNTKKYAKEMREKWRFAILPTLRKAPEVRKAWFEAGCTDPDSYIEWVLQFILGKMSSGMTARDMVQHRFRAAGPRFVNPSGLSDLEQIHQLTPRGSALEVWITSDKIFGNMCYTMGEATLKVLDGWHLGYFMLQAACEVGRVDAALRLVQFERHDRRLIADSRAWTMVKQDAESGTDWRTKVVYAQSLVDRQTSAPNRQKAFELSHQAFRMTQSSGTPDTDPVEARLGTWRPLQSLAADRFHRHQSPDDEVAIKKAIRDGAFDYHDPLACLWFARSNEVETNSKQWVELMTKAAMDGQPHLDGHEQRYEETAAEDLAKYYLELHGWYPCTGKASPERSEMLGFEWLEVAAYAHANNSEHVCKPFLKMAVMMRENGHSRQGLAYLQKGLAQLDDILADEADRVVAKAYLQKLIHNWEGALPPEATLYALFGDPEMVRR